jgi:hypothetical protein
MFNFRNVRPGLIVFAFATAMAWVEAAVVFYLRSMMDRLEPYQPDPLPALGGFGSVELPREFATLVMLFTAGWLAGRTWRARLGYAAIAFGVWDIFYYVFLKVMCGWPHSLLDWDILFLLPLPWWGPVLAPILISLLLIAWGTFASRCPGALRVHGGHPRGRVLWSGGDPHRAARTIQLAAVRGGVAVNVRADHCRRPAGPAGTRKRMVKSRHLTSG